MLLLTLIAGLYASVGHGGASGYLALMAIFGFAPEMMRSSALTLNLLVSSVAFISFYRNGYFRWSIILPLISVSIPAAFLGATISVDPTLYRILLGICLLIAVFRMVFIKGLKNQELRRPVNLYLLLSGAGIGVLSGMIGIGGGIILSPLLLLLRWTTVKQAAGISALFIFINSMAGIAGLLSAGMYRAPLISWWIAAVLVGGFAGSLLGSNRFAPHLMKKILAFVLLLAAFKLLIY